tara:strand:- start:539 stop:1558 length:1020 start_codon:yes stop_codon:yes gene_type:complete
MISVGIIGASGYTGEELVKILQNHPDVQIKALTSRTHAGKHINDVFNLETPIDGHFKTPNIENLLGCDVVFFATPNGVAMNMAKELLDNKIRIIDISADFRIKSVDTWEKWYGRKHASPLLLSDSVYGLPEIPGQKEKIREALIVANPGCYPTSALLSLLPIAKDLKKQKIIINATSGISGAGRNLDSRKLFPEGEDNYQAYAVRAHRHYPEILQTLGDDNDDLDVLFVPHLSSMNRGLYSTLYLQYDFKEVDEVVEGYKSFYSKSSFVEVTDANEFPKASEVVKTNRCKISLHKADSAQGDVNLVILSAIDNLVKGASGQAVQNMNIMFNIDEKRSLT